MTATVRLARAITRLNARPFPARLSRDQPADGRDARRARDRPAARGVHPGPPAASRSLRRGVRPAQRRDARDRAHDHRRHPAQRQPRRQRARPRRAEAIVNVRIAVGSTVAETLAPHPPGDPRPAGASRGGRRRANRRRSRPRPDRSGTAVRREHRRRASGCDRHAVRDARRERQPALHRDQRRGLPLHAVRDERRGARHAARPQRAHPRRAPGCAGSASTPPCCVRADARRCAAVALRASSVPPEVGELDRAAARRQLPQCARAPGSARRARRCSRRR